MLRNHGDATSDIISNEGWTVTVMDAWLKAAGLERHLDAFRAHRIEFDQLADLNDDDLRELGLTIGERKRFRRAVQESIERENRPEPSADTLAERRPLTVAFIDLVGSSALAQQLEDEDMIEVLRRYREFCGTAIARYGGSIAHFLGDGILAHFCYPLAHENDPERAIRASLEITGGIAGLETPAAVPLGVRIGIATGRVVVSDVFAAGAAERQTAVGTILNLAARLQTLAPVNGVVVSQATYERIAAFFSFEDLGLCELRGFRKPQQAFRLLAELPADRPSGKKPTRLTPIFSRESELAALAAHWERAESGDGSLMFVIGEAGIGKSRLVERFLAEIGEGTARIVTLAASPFNENSPLRPFLAFFRSMADLEPNAPAAVRTARLRAIIRGAEDREIALRVLERLLVSAGAERTEDTLPPAKQRALELDVFCRQILALADDMPLCLVIEDLHWLDPTSQELLALLGERTKDRRILLVVTSREEPAAEAWTDVEGVQILRLSRLWNGDVVSMVQSLFGKQPVPDRIAHQIAHKTDGIPLFIEEFVRTLLRARPHVDWNEIALSESDPVSIPASLHEALAARLDNSGPAKELAQVAAVIGRVTRRDILTEVSGLSEAALERALAALREVAVLDPVLVDGRQCYAFGHALVRDAAYDSLLRDRRRELHRKVAEALEALDPEDVSAQPELLAHHLTEGGLLAEAVEYWLEAGRRSLARSSLVEAVRLLQRGLAVLDLLPVERVHFERRLELVALLGPALIAVKGPGSPEARALYGSAYELCLTTPESRLHFPVYWGWWRMARDCRIMKARASALLQRANKSSDPAMLLQAHHCCWASEYDSGNLRGCCEHIEAGLSIYSHADYRDHASLYGNHDAKVCAHGNLAQVFWMQGKVGSALAEEQHSLEWAQQLAHLGSTIHAMDMALLHRTYRREYREVLTQAEDLIRFTAEQGFADHRAKGLIFRGWAAAMLGEPAQGLEALQAGLRRQQEIGTSEDFPIYVSLHAEILMACGKADQAVAELERALAEFENLGLKIWLAEVWRILGDARLAADAAAIDAAAQAYGKAARIAAEQGAVMLGLRTRMSQARLALHYGTERHSLTELRSARAAIENGGSSVDLTAADQLIATLAKQNGDRLVRNGGP